MIITTISTSNKLNPPRNRLAPDVMQKVWPFFITFLQKEKGERTFFSGQTLLCFGAGN